MRYEAALESERLFCGFADDDRGGQARSGQPGVAGAGDKTPARLGLGAKSFLCESLHFLGIFQNKSWFFF